MEERYKKMFSRVKASPEKIQEVIAMTEKRKPGRVVRNLLVAAAIMALAVLTAMGANAASGGELFSSVVSYVFDGEDLELEYRLDDGSTFDGNSCEYEIVDGENGKAILTYTDESGNRISKDIDAFQFKAQTEKTTAE